MDGLRARVAKLEAIVVPVPVPVEPEPFYTAVFDYDGLRTDPNIIHNHDFMREPRYIAAMKCGNTAQGLDTDPDADLRPAYWRLHVGTWCAAHAVKLGGDFVECGVWKGFMSAAIMRYLDWNTRGRRFFLFDTFCGLDESQLNETERANEEVLAHFRKHYVENYQQVVDTFREFQDVHVIRGRVPETLATVNIERVSYLSLDMNNITPELAAANFFWDAIVPGGMILLDDYGFVHCRQQKVGFDRFAREKGVEILALAGRPGLEFSKP